MLERNHISGNKVGRLDEMVTPERVGSAPGPTTIQIAVAREEQRAYVNLLPSSVTLDLGLGSERVHKGLDSVTGVSLFDETDGGVDLTKKGNKEGKEEKRRKKRKLSKTAGDGGPRPGHADGQGRRGNGGILTKSKRTIPTKSSQSGGRPPPFERAMATRAAPSMTHERGFHMKDWISTRHETHQ